MLVPFLPKSWNDLLLSVGFGELPLEELKERYADPKDGSRFILVDGLNIHYRDEGNPNGPVLVMIHGIMSSLHTWDGWVEKMSQKYRIIRFDVPGWGLTGSLPDQKITPQNVMDTMLHFLDALHIQKSTLIGNSLGGYFAWNLAVDHPERVEQLILLDPACYVMAHLPLQIRLGKIPGAPHLFPIWMPRFIISMSVAQLYGDMSRIKPDIIQRYYDISRRPGNRKAMALQFRTLLESNYPILGETPQKVRQLKMPTLLMWGELDRWIPLDMTHLWRRDLTHIKVIEYAGVGHIPMEEIPEQSAADAMAFLEANHPKSSDKNL